MRIDRYTFIQSENRDVMDFSCASAIGESPFVMPVLLEGIGRLRLGRI